jgi:hypothetical protein
VDTPEIFLSPDNFQQIKLTKMIKNTKAMNNSGRFICNFGPVPVTQRSTKPIYEIHARILIHVRIMTGAGDDNLRTGLCVVDVSIVLRGIRVPGTRHS